MDRTIKVAMVCAAIATAATAPAQTTSREELRAQGKAARVTSEHDGVSEGGMATDPSTPRAPIKREGKSARAYSRDGAQDEQRPLAAPVIETPRRRSDVKSEARASSRQPDAIVEGGLAK